LSGPALRPLRLLRLANPVVRRLLDSPLHPLLSGRLTVLTYHGHRSGRTFSIPVRYAAMSDGRLVALAVDRRRKLWWRSFATPRDATVMLRRERIPVVGRVAEGRGREEASAAYTARYRRSGRLVADAALVVFEPSG
jgi:hypothetical protein